MIDTGYWILDNTDLILYAGYYKLDGRYWILDDRYWMMDTRYYLLDTGCDILNTIYYIPDDRYWILRTGCLILPTRCQIRDTGYQILHTGCYMLDATYWFAGRSQCKEYENQQSMRTRTFWDSFSLKRTNILRRYQDRCSVW